MNKILKYGLIILGFGIISIIGLIGIGLHGMEIEDHYGNPELYYESKTGDLIINRTMFDFGIIQKNWTRIRIITQKKDSIDLFNWIYQNGVETKIEIFRPNREINLDKITYSELERMIDKSELQFVIKN